MVCRAYGGQAKILMGFPESGMRLIEASIAHARHQNNAHSLAWALGVAAHTSQLQHEPATTARFASEAIEIAREHRLPQWLALGETCKGWAIHQLGDFEGGLNLLRQGVRRWYETGAALHTTRCEICLAESYLLARPRRGGAVPFVGRTSSSQKLWRKLSRGGNRSTGGFVAAVRGRAYRNDRRMPEEVPRHGAPTRSATFRTPFRHRVSPDNGRTQ